METGSCEWNEKIARLFDARDSDALSEALYALIHAVVPLESFIIFHYHLQEIPEIIYQKTDHRHRRNNLEKYLDGAYLLDPFYQAFFAGQTSQIVTLKDIAPDHFRRSEYYRTYYKSSGLKDEVNIYLRLSEQSSLVLALGRDQKGRHFSKYELKLLADIFPILNAASLRQWADRTGGHSEEDKGNLRFLRGLENFGTSCLSAKESEVLHLLLMGHSAKSTAARMAISPGTVKIHRNNIYAKLDINSQTELFSLFIAALAHMQGDGSEDPLVAFHKAHTQSSL